MAQQFGQVAVDLRRAFVETRLRLGKLQGLDLRRMESLLGLLRRAPRGAELALAFGQVLLGRALHLARRVFGSGSGGQHAGQFVDLALAFDYAVGLRIRHI